MKKKKVIDKSILYKKLKDEKELREHPNTKAEDRRLRQRAWGKARSEEIKQHLWKLGHSFDLQPKHIF